MSISRAELRELAAQWKSEGRSSGAIDNTSMTARNFLSGHSTRPGGKCPRAGFFI